VDTSPAQTFTIQINRAPAFYDYGDAPDPLFFTAGHYPTLRNSDGARHRIPSSESMLYLGAVAPDPDSDGQPHYLARGDDNSGVDDEDGVVLPEAFLSGQAAEVQVLASAEGFLNGWVDWNKDGDWDDPGEQVFQDTVLAGGRMHCP